MPREMSKEVFPAKEGKGEGIDRPRLLRKLIRYRSRDESVAAWIAKHSRPARGGEVVVRSAATYDFPIEDDRVDAQRRVLRGFYRSIDQDPRYGVPGDFLAGLEEPDPTQQTLDQSPENS